MRRLAITVAFGGLALAIFLYVQPYLTMRVLAESLRSSDTPSIRERMDAERVRQSLRDGYLARLDHEATEADRNAAAIASLALFGRGLEMIMATVHDREDAGAELTKWTYESTTRVRATLLRGQDAPIAVVLERQRTSWQLVAMEPSEPAWRELQLKGHAPPSQP